MPMTLANRARMGGDYGRMHKQIFTLAIEEEMGKWSLGLDTYGFASIFSCSGREAADWDCYTGQESTPGKDNQEE